MALQIPSSSDISDLLKRGEVVKAQDLFLTMRELVLELREEIQGLKQKCQELENRAKSKLDVSFKDNVCWISGDPQPICPLCFEKEGQTVHLSGPFDDGDGDIRYGCKVHDATFYTRLTSQPARPRRNFDSIPNLM